MRLIFFSTFEKVDLNSIANVKEKIVLFKNMENLPTPLEEKER